MAICVSVASSQDLVHPEVSPRLARGGVLFGHPKGSGCHSGPISELKMVTRLWQKETNRFGGPLGRSSFLSAPFWLPRSEGGNPLATCPQEKETHPC